jgi:Rieske 2Fe-2S family protein
MNARYSPSISDLLKSRRAGYSLPQAMYLNADVFRTDVEVFFRKHWIVVGVDAELSEPGDVKVIDIDETSIVLARDDDGRLQAFHNVCRHRGARLVLEEKTNVGRLVCPYHQWTYDLEGTLLHASSMQKSFDPSCHSLQPVQVRSIAGIIMVCIDGDAPSDIDFLADVMIPRLERFDLGNAKVAVERTIIEEGNWKLSIDNNRECYHCAGAHPELSVAIHPLDLTCELEGLSEDELDEWKSHVASTTAKTAHWEAAGFPSSLIEEMGGRATIFRTHRFDIAGSGESHTMDTKSACSILLGGIKDPRLGDLHFWTHNSWHHFFADHAVISYILPLSPHRTELRSVWLVHKDAVERRDYHIDRLTEVWDATNQQDADLVRITQQGVKSPAYVPGPLSESLERLVDLNMQWYIDRLRAHGY